MEAMNETMLAAQAFFEKSRSMPDDDRREALKELPKDVQNEYWEIRKNSFFVPENAVLKDRCEKLSPSGKYRLVVTPYSTTRGAWHYTQGLVYAVGSDEPIAEIRRNYSCFPFLFVENHPKTGKDYLVCGADYQGQTIIELGTGTRRDLMSDGSEEGWGFCWAAYTFDAPSCLLVVDGCHWACPYEYRFYDFSDPLSGWPQVEPEEYIDADTREPTIHPDGTITCYETKDPEDEEDDETDPSKRVLAATRTFRREGLKLVQISEWVSEAEQKDRQAREEGNRRYEAWLKNYKASDPLYLERQAQLQDPAWTNAEVHDGVGVTYKDWCPTWDGNERRICCRILNRVPKDPNKRFTVVLEWATDTGPIKVEVYKDGNSHETKFFPHSVEAMREAFAYAKSFTVAAGAA